MIIISLLQRLTNHFWWSHYWHWCLQKIFKRWLSLRTFLSQ